MKSSRTLPSRCGQDSAIVLISRLQLTLIHGLCQASLTGAHRWYRPCLRLSLSLWNTTCGSPLFTSVNPSCHEVRLEPSLAPQSLSSDNLTNHNHSEYPPSPPLLSGATTTGHVTRTSGFLLYHLYPLHPLYSGNRHPVRQLSLKPCKERVMLVD